jgi:3-hydroxybutyrate dehydrogenase
LIIFSGIGLGLARAFAKAKYNIIFNGLEKNGNDIAAKIAKEFQVDHLFSPANALHSDQLRAMVDDGLSRFKHIGWLDVFFLFLKILLFIEIFEF